MSATNGNRTGFHTLPGSLHAALEALLGEQIVAAVSQSGGFSPGSADRCTLASGRRAFIKAVDSGPHPYSAKLHRSEAAMAAGLPGNLPIPAFLGVVEEAGWVALAFEDIDGVHPDSPWQPAQLGSALDALQRLADLEPGLVPDFLPTAAQSHGPLFAGWERLLEHPSPGPWDAEGIRVLAALAAGSSRALSGGHLLHADLRADNMLIDAAGNMILVDWPHACRGPEWFDALSLLVNAATFDARFDPEPWLAKHPVFAGATRDDVSAVLAGFAGYFMDAARKPAPAGLPALRAFQQLQGTAVLRWLDRRGDRGPRPVSAGGA